MLYCSFQSSAKADEEKFVRPPPRHIREQSIEKREENHLEQKNTLHVHKQLCLLIEKHLQTKIHLLLLISIIYISYIKIKSKIERERNH